MRTFLTLTQFASLRQVCKPVEHGQIFRWESGIIHQDHPPTIPGKELYFIERSHIPEEISFDEVNPMHGEDAKLVGICLSAAAHFPCRAADDELIAWHVEGIKR